MIGWLARRIQKRKLDKYSEYWGHRTDVPLCIKCKEPMEKAEGPLHSYEYPGMDGFRCVSENLFL